MSVANQIEVLERRVLEKQTQQLALVKELEQAHQERVEAELLLESSKRSLEETPTLDAALTQSFSQLSELREQRQVELQVAEAELVAAENALRWQVEEQHKADTQVAALAAALKERYIKAKRALGMFDVDIDRKLEMVRSVEAEQRHEAAKIEEILSAADKLSSAVVDTQRRALVAASYGLNDTFRDASSLLCESSVSLPTAECRIPIPPGKLRFLTSRFGGQGEQGFGALRRKFRVHVAVEDGPSLKVVVAGHVNGVHRCVTEIENALTSK